MAVVWCLPDTTKKITSEYILEVPKDISPSYYLWISTGRRLPYKTQCFVNRLKRTIEYEFKNPANYKAVV